MSSAVSGAEAGPTVAPAALKEQSGSRVFFQSQPLGSPTSAAPRLQQQHEEEDASLAAAAAHKQQQQRRQQQGKVTVKYDRKELRKRLVLEEWIVEQLSALYECEEWSDNGLLEPIWNHARCQGIIDGCGNFFKKPVSSTRKH